MIKPGDMVRVLPYDPNFPDGVLHHSLPKSVIDYVVGCIGRSGPYMVVGMIKSTTIRHVKIEGREGKIVCLKACYFAEVQKRTR